MQKTKGAHRERAEDPDALCRRARALLEKRFGAGSAEEESTVVGFARGVAGVLSEHTHYSDGFGVLMPMPQGAAVAVRPAPEAPSRLAGAGATWAVEAAASGRQPLPVRVAAAAVRAFAPVFVEAAVVSSVPRACFDAALTAPATAAARALRLLSDDPSDPEPTGGEASSPLPTFLEDARRLLADTSGGPFSRAYPLAAATGRPPDFTLVDTATGEHLPVELPAPEALGRALVLLPDVSFGEETAFHRKRRRQAREALAQLRAGGFQGLRTFRNLEHRDLDRALALLAPSLRPIARHLVTENRRVPKFVAAARRGDGQLLGALPSMSHASLRQDWQSTSPALDLLVETAQTGALDGVYGARMTGRGPCALLLGRPDALPAALDRLADVLAEQHDLRTETMLL